MGGQKKRESECWRITWGKGNTGGQSERKTDVDAQNERERNKGG